MAVTKTWANPETATGSGGLDIATGATLSEAIWDRMASCLDFLGGSSGAYSAYANNSAAQSVNNNTNTVLSWNSEFYDTESMHSTSSNTSRITVPVSGIYLAMGQVAFAANATGQRLARIISDGAVTWGASSVPANSGSYVTYVQVQALLNLSASSYIELQVYQDSGGALNANSDSVLAVAKL